MKPELENIPFHKGSDSVLCQRLFIILLSKWPDLIPEQNHNGKDRSKLDHHFKHTVKFFRYIQGYNFIQQNHMSGTADRKPLRNPLYNTKQNCF